MALSITSNVFKDGEMIPRRYTCDGEDLSPPLAWSGVTEKALSLVLICDDPDAPVGTWVHWVLFNLPPDLEDLPEGMPDHAKLKQGGVHGQNSWGRFGYGGPCPPGGTHRYFFKLYALDSKLTLNSGASKAELLKAMEGHILDEGQLMGRYRR